jgi:two-component system cell cycle response regulator DivK
MTEQKKILVLVVDDVEDNRDIYAQYLAYKGFQVALASDGFEAFDKAYQLQPDLIVMDLSLPGMDGWEATRKLKRNDKTKHIPVMALTAHAHEGVAEGAREAGCDGFVTKPCAPDELAKSILQMLREKETNVQKQGSGKVGAH